MPKELTALMSAVPTGNHDVPNDSSKRVFTFEQKVVYVFFRLLYTLPCVWFQVPIPSYLVAIAVGALESR